MGHRPDNLKIPIADAIVIYNEIVDHLFPSVRRDSPVGSLRRGEPLIGDIDIQIEVLPDDVPRVRASLEEIGTWVRGGERSMIIDYGLPGAQIRVEVSLVYPPRNWWSMLAIRTGPAEMEQWMRRQLARDGFTGKVGEIDVVCEESFFENHLGVGYVKPSERSTFLYALLEFEPEA